MNTCCPPNLSGIRWYRSLLSIFRRNRVRPHVPSDSEWLSWALRYKNNKYSIILYKYSSYVYNTLQSFTTWTYCVKLPRAVTTMRILSKLFRESILILFRPVRTKVRRHTFILVPVFLCLWRGTLGYRV